MSKEQRDTQCTSENGPNRKESVMESQQEKVAIILEGTSDRRDLEGESRCLVTVCLRAVRDTEAEIIAEYLTKETVFAEMRNSVRRVIWEGIDEFVYRFVDCEVCIS